MGQEPEPHDAFVPKSDDPLARLAPRFVHRAARVSEHVIDYLQELIFDGQLEPGTPIRQEALAAYFGVSRTPLREALRRLEQDGLIRISDHGVASVAVYSPQESRDLLELRELIDGLAARTLAVKGITDDVANELDQLATAMEEASCADDKHAFLTRNADFHLLILEASAHPPLQQFKAHLRITSQALYMQRGHQPLRHQRSAVEHRAILDALKDGDGVRAERLAREHIVAAAEHWFGPAEASGDSASASRASGF